MIRRLLARRRDRRLVRLWESPGAGGFSLVLLAGLFREEYGEDAPGALEYLAAKARLA